MLIDNPFPVTRYASPSLFCDREQELAILTGALRNGRHILLYSPRRFGKTGLIHHTFNTLAKDRGTRTVFADIYAARDVHDFNTILVNAVHAALNPTVKQFLRNAGEWFGALRPTVSFDELSGKPRIGLERAEISREAATTTEIFRILNEQDRTIYLAIDEFQQVAQFANVRMDALLRSELQRSPRVHCIFSGSQRHLLLEMFTDVSSPLYHSADQLSLGRIERDTYSRFAVRLMKRHGRDLSLDDARLCYDWCNGHTYHVQVLFNRLFGDARPLSRDTIVQVMLGIVREQDAMMATLRSTLPGNQWDLYAAIAREGAVDTPTGGAFMRKHGLSSSAAVVQAMKALLDKELVYVSGHVEDSGKPVYETYDPFLRNWFRHR